jgi:SMC interacting uncharacterized protein involved in chromosome segregation
VITGLASTGVFRILDNKETERMEIRENISEARKMIEDIRKNGSGKYQNMDDCKIILARLALNYP